MVTTEPKGLTAIVVDDDRTVRTVLRELLAKLAVEVREAEDGPTALRLMKESPPDCLLVDLMMPGMDGEPSSTRSDEHRVSPTSPSSPARRSTTRPGSPPSAGGGCATTS